MFIESFRHIIEIEGLKKQNDENYKRISSENKRISDLVERRNKTEKTIENLKIQEMSLKLEETQQLIEDLQAREKQLTTQTNLAVTKKEQDAFESQIALVKEEKEKAEAIYFKNLEESEAIQAEREDLLEFLEGSRDTLVTISLEVEANITKEKLLIENRQKRIDSLLDNLHPDARKFYEQIDTKQQKKPSVAFVIGRKCSECHIQLDSTMKSTLEQGISLESCPNCGRLLIPESAKVF